MGVRGKTAPIKEAGGGFWQWLNVPAGPQSTGWIAGDIHTYPAHLGKPSYVCEKTLGVPGHVCTRCNKDSPVGLLGYLPVYRDDNKPCVLVLHEHTFDAVGRLPFLAPIAWGRRSAETNEPVWVKPLLNGPKYTTTLPERRQPQDITLAMCRYWRRRDLYPYMVNWLNVAAAVAAEMEEPAAPPVEPVQRVTVAGKGRSSSRKAIEAVTGEPMEELLSETAKNMLARVRAREREAERNGSHH